MMNLSKLIAILTATIICFNSGHAFAQDTEKWSGSCEIIFSGKSTLHNFNGSVKSKPFRVTASNMTDKSKASISSRVTAKATKMDTQNKKRDVKMHDVMNISTYPDVTVDVVNLTAANTKPVKKGSSSHPTVIPFILTVKGKKQQITGSVTNWVYSKDKISCTVSFPVSLKASGIVVPTVLGFIKVQDEIQVKSILIFKKQVVTEAKVSR